MADQLLLKGLEEEVYTGLPDGTIVGLSHLAKRDLEGFATEPDARNCEFVSPPLRNYDEIGCTLMTERRKLRQWLKTQGDYTIIPGSTMSTGDSTKFHISDEDNAYYRYIRDTYFTRVVTASVHISIGIEDPETIVRASRVLRMEACIFLALSASSPFLDGKATGFHSYRWKQFPHTPAHVPLFTSHDDYRRFVRHSIEAGDMQNTRHLWTSCRPNGSGVPDDINRVELRVCDQLHDPQRLVAAAALTEARVWQILEDDQLDPLVQSEIPAAERADDLVQIHYQNNKAVMTRSLDATVVRWQDGKPVHVRDWLDEYYESALETARARDFCSYLSPIRDILTTGNTAQQWMTQYQQGMSVREIITAAIGDMEQAEVEHSARVCK